MTTLRSQRNAATTQTTELRDKLARVQKDYDGVRAQADVALDQLRGERDKMAHELDAAVARVNEIVARDEVGEWKRKVAALEAALEEKKVALADVKQKSSVAITQLREKNAQLTAKIGELAATDEATASEATRELRLQNAELQSKLNEMIGSLEETRRQDEQIVAKNRELMASLEILEAEHMAVRDNARATTPPSSAAASTATTAVAAEVAAAQRALETERTRTAEALARVHELDKELEQQRAKVDQLSSRAASLEADLTSARASQSRDQSHSKELEALKREKRQLERDNRENLELVERMQKEKFETLEQYSASQRACEKLAKTVAQLEQTVARLEDAQLAGGGDVGAGGAGGGSSARGGGTLVLVSALSRSVAGDATVMGAAAWRRVNQCLPPLSSLPTVQRISAMLIARPKEKNDDSLVEFNETL